MPSKSAHLIAFLTISALSAGSHRFVYVHLKALILKDFGKRAQQIRRTAAALFILFDLPFLYLFLSKWISGGHDDLARAVLYPFSLWQALMLFWTAILLVRLFVRRTFGAGAAVLRIARSRHTTIVSEIAADTAPLEPTA